MLVAREPRSSGMIVILIGIEDRCLKRTPSTIPTLVSVDDVRQLITRTSGFSLRESGKTAKVSTARIFRTFPDVRPSSIEAGNEVICVVRFPRVPHRVG